MSLQEAKDSSAIENIITTHDELYKAELLEKGFHNAAAKEVSIYANALKEGFGLVRKQRIISNNTVLQIQRTLEGNDAGYRRQAGTTLKNERTGEIVYTPPQDHATIVALMDNLLQFIHEELPDDLDPLVKMAILHHRFESIHPFYDGNGRTGRILNILYLVKEDLLTLPILYLSRYIIQNKADYYRLLQEVRDKDVWEEWILFMVRGVAETAQQTLVLIEGIRDIMQDYKTRLRTALPRIYSQELLNNLFKHPYTKIEFLEEELAVQRKTAAKYLNALVDGGFLSKVKIGRTNFYVNDLLFNFLRQGTPFNPDIESIRTIHETS